MRKVIVLEHISLDGVIQAPGEPDDDTSGGFAYGAPCSGSALEKRIFNRSASFFLFQGLTPSPCPVEQ